MIKGNGFNPTCRREWNRSDRKICFTKQNQSHQVPPPLHGIAEGLIISCQTLQKLRLMTNARSICLEYGSCCLIEANLSVKCGVDYNEVVYLLGSLFWSNLKCTTSDETFNSYYIINAAMSRWYISLCNECTYPKCKLVLMRPPPPPPSPPLLNFERIFGEAARLTNVFNFICICVSSIA